MRILSAAEVKQALPMAEAIDGMKQAYAALSAGQAQMPDRLKVPVAEQEAIALFMPAYLPQPSALAVKAVSVFPHNPTRGLDLIQAAVLALDPETGQPLALLEGKTLTAIRTGAASGAATDLLARPDSHVLALFGAGKQAAAQVEAVCTVRPIQTVWIYDPDANRAAALAARIRGQGPVPADVRPAQSPAQAVAEADVICTVTTAENPVFAHQDLKAGVHINALGAYRPDMREIPPETVGAARLFVDHFPAVQHEAGDLLFALESGLLSLADLQEIGDLVRGEAEGRQSAQEITLFKSVGVAVQDAIAAHIALKNARQHNLGVQINFLEETP